MSAKNEIEMATDKLQSAATALLNIDNDGRFWIDRALDLLEQAKNHIERVRKTIGEQDERKK